MELLAIEIYGSEILRKHSEPVAEVTPELVELAEKMLDTMYEAPGIGLAAPQVGKNIQLIVADVAKEDEEPEPYIIFNPEISFVEEDNPIVDYEEGCLSVPDIFANVQRPEFINVKGINEKGETFEMKNVGGLLSRCIQHEVDHLNGTLFVDKISAADKSINQSKLRKMAKGQKK
ncbi:MAG: peptide deformylase [Fibrobacter sp.]|nr:peptide deformylase [Fibrobacter sp.]